MKNINLFKILAIITILTIINLILVANIIAKSSFENKLNEEQVTYFKEYASEKLLSEKTKELLNKLNLNIDKNSNNPELVPMVEYYGEDNKNYKIIYTVEDEYQKEIYKKELNEIVTQIQEKDNYYVVLEYDDNKEYIKKVVIEYNY